MEVIGIEEVRVLHGLNHQEIEIAQDLRFRGKP